MPRILQYPNVLQLRVSDQQLALISKRAKKLHLTVSEFLRAAGTAKNCAVTEGDLAQGRNGKKSRK